MNLFDECALKGCVNCKDYCCGALVTRVKGRKGYAPHLNGPEVDLALPVSAAPPEMSAKFGRPRVMPSRSANLG